MVKFGVVIPQEGLAYETIRAAAKECERLGYDSLWVNDHFFFSPQNPYLECWTLLSALAGETERLRLGALVLCNSYRHPPLLAKMAATLDVISGGRLEFGIGAGWHRKEYRAYGIDFPQAYLRVAQLNEAVQIIKKLWTEEKSTFKGKHYSIDGAFCSPKPVQKPHPPIWVGGMGRQLLKVVARHADGCHMERFDLTPTEYSSRLMVLREHCKALGRDYEDIRKSISIFVVVGRTRSELKKFIHSMKSDRPPVAALLSLERVGEAIRHPRRAMAFLGSRVLGLTAPPSAVVGTPDECVASLNDYAKLGVDYFILRFPCAGMDEVMRIFAEEVLPSFKRH